MGAHMDPMDMLDEDLEEQRMARLAASAAPVPAEPEAPPLLGAPGADPATDPASPAVQEAAATDQTTDELLRQYFSKRQALQGDIESASDQARMNRLGVGIAEAGGRLGHAMSRATTPFDASGFKTLNDAANAPLERMKLRRDADKDEMMLLRNYFLTKERGNVQRDLNDQRITARGAENEKNRNLREKLTDKTLGVRQTEGEANRANARRNTDVVASAAQRRFETTKLENAQKGYASATKDVEGQIDNLKQVSGLAKMAEKNPVAAAAVPIQMARAVGEKGPLSDFDVKNWGGSQALDARLNRWSEKISEGTMTPEDSKQMQDLANEMMAHARNKLQRIEQERVGQYTQLMGGDAQQNKAKLKGELPPAPATGLAPKAGGVGAANGQPKRFVSKDGKKEKLVYPDGRTVIREIK